MKKKILAAMTLNLFISFSVSAGMFDDISMKGIYSFFGFETQVERVFSKPKGPRF